MRFIKISFRKDIEEMMTEKEISEAYREVSDEQMKTYSKTLWKNPPQKKILQSFQLFCFHHLFLSVRGALHTVEKETLQPC